MPLEDLKNCEIEIRFDAIDCLIVFDCGIDYDDTDCPFIWIDVKEIDPPSIDAELVSAVCFEYAEELLNERSQDAP